MTRTEKVLSRFYKLLGLGQSRFQGTVASLAFIAAAYAFGS